MSTRSYLSIGDVLTLLRQEFPDVTISKIRFLESQGLVNPERTPSGYRKFYEHDVERLRWVLRQQREHFLPLKVIKDRLEDDPAGAAETATATVPDDTGAAVPSAAEPVLVGQRSSRAENGRVRRATCGRHRRGGIDTAGDRAGAGDARAPRERRLDRPDRVGARAAEGSELGAGAGHRGHAGRTGGRSRPTRRGVPGTRSRIRDAGREHRRCDHPFGQRHGAPPRAGRAGRRRTHRRSGRGDRRPLGDTDLATVVGDRTHLRLGRIG